jgi:hypothetical protein
LNAIYADHTILQAGFAIVEVGMIIDNPFCWETFAISLNMVVVGCRAVDCGTGVVKDSRRLTSLRGEEKMNWKFWKKGSSEEPVEKVQKYPKPKELPEAVGRKLVVSLKIDPDEAWALRYVSRPSESKPGIQDFRLFAPNKTAKAGLVVKDWSSLDDHPDLILFEGHYDRSSKTVEFRARTKSAA